MIAFTIFDFVFFISFIFFSLRGFLNGVVKELLSLLIWLSSLALAWGLRQFPINFFEINSQTIGVFFWDFCWGKVWDKFGGNNLGISLG